MQGLLYGVKPERWTPPDDSNHLLVGLSKTPDAAGGAREADPHP